MPELPEVETVRQGIADHAVGRRILRSRVYAPRAIRHQVGGAGELEGLLTGRTITGAHRRGKYLWLRLAGGGGPEDHALMIHLGMSGQVLIRTGDLPPHRHLRAAFDLEGGSHLWFVDQRMFGYVGAVLLAPDPHGARHLGGGWIPETMTHIGPDLLEPGIAPGTPARAALNRRIRRTSRGIKTVLLDQEITSGIGNIYADEALWRVRMHYSRPASRLAPRAVEDLLGAATDVMREALAAGGTSFDELYVDVAGEQGYFERSLAAYGRQGQGCHRCGEIIVREAFQNRSSYRCPRCQRRPARSR